MKLVCSFSEKDTNSFYLMTCSFTSEEWFVSWASTHLIIHITLFLLTGGKFSWMSTYILVKTAIFSSYACCR